MFVHLSFHSILARKRGIWRERRLQVEDATPAVHEAYHDERRDRKGVVKGVPEHSPAREFHRLRAKIATHQQEKQHV